MQRYIVQNGDTLYGISKQYGISVEEIKLANNLENNNIVVGQSLIIPKVGNTLIYVVQSGDSLYSIARKYGVTVNSLIDINNLSSNLLSIGQKLKIPVINTDNNYYLYTVKVGDTLYSIARSNNTTVDTIKVFNNLNSNLLNVGQQLKIPIDNKTEEESDYLIYVVKEGDSLYSIARKYGMNVNDLITLNNLTSNVLSIGQQLRIISNKDNVIPIGSSCYGEGYMEPTFITYVVKRGDNLYNIAKKYNVSVDSIIKLNNLNSNNLSIGQVLKIKEVV